MEGFLFTGIGYLFGCFQSAFIFTKLFHKTDIRKLGSCNPGTMNTYLSFGKNLGLLVLFCDLMKTVIASLLCVLISSKTDALVVISLTCLGVSLGHNFPFWLKFKGGKGIAVAIASALLLDVRILLVSLLVSAVFALVMKSFVYGSYTFAVMMFVSCAVFGYESIIVFSFLVQSVNIWLLHYLRDNTRQPITRKTAKG